MIKPLIPIESVGLDVIKKHVLAKRPLLNYELELVRRVTCKDERLPDVKPARNFFLTDFSDPFLTYIATEICQEESASEIKGEYFEFISKKDIPTQTPYYKLTLFQGKGHSSLQTYVCTITTRYFCHQVEKVSRLDSRTLRIDEDDHFCQNFVGSDLIENMWYQTLIQRDDESMCDSQQYRELEKALSQLPQRERLILQLMIMDGASGLEAFEDLEPYIAPTAKTPTSTWTNKQKQDAMSLLKARALDHLRRIILK